MNYISICAGVGGFDLGLDRAGFTCLAQCEGDPNDELYSTRARDVLARHWPDADRSQIDLTTFDGRRFHGSARLVCGGTPCQAWSVAGLRHSLSDAKGRGNLAFEFVRVCNEVDPEWIIWENVPGVLSTKDNAFGCFVAALVGADRPLTPTGKRGGRWTDAGMVVGPRRWCAWRVLNAEHFGVPQRRRRVFVVAGTGDRPRPEVLFERAGMRRDSSKGFEAWTNPAGSANDRIEKSSGNAQRMTRGSDTVCSLTANGAGTCGADDNQAQAGHIIVHDRQIANALTASLGHHGHSSPRGDGSDNLIIASVAAPVAINMRGREEGNVPEISDVASVRAASGGSTRSLIFADMIASNAEGGEGLPSLTASNVGKTINNQTPIVGFQESQSGFRETEAHATLDSNYGSQRHNGVLQSGLRRLTPIECERLMSYPDNWTRLGDSSDEDDEEMLDGTRYRMCGNGVVSVVSEWIGRRIMVATAT